MKTNEPNKNRRSIYIPPEVYEPALAQAQRQGTNLSLVIRQFLKMWLDGKIKPEFDEPPK
jgi:hypothetical protein